MYYYSELYVLHSGEYRMAVLEAAIQLCKGVYRADRLEHCFYDLREFYKENVATLS